MDKINAHKAVAENLAELNAAMAAIPKFVEITQKWDGKAFDLRFAAALCAVPNVLARVRWDLGDLEILWIHGRARIELAYSRVGKAHPPVNAEPIVKSLERGESRIAWRIGAIKKTECAIGAIKRNLKKMEMMKKGLISEYDRKTLVAYFGEERLKNLGI